MSAWKFYLVTFGCKVNQYETQSLREAWLALGGVECNAPALADVVCVNSCAITSKGERDARNAVFKLRRRPLPHVLSSPAASHGCLPITNRARGPLYGLRPICWFRKKIKAACSTAPGLILTAI